MTVLPGWERPPDGFGWWTGNDGLPHRMYSMRGGRTNIAFNLSRAIGTLAGADLGKERTIRRKLITFPPGSRPRHGKSPCTCQLTGPGKPAGHTSSKPSGGHHGPPPSDHPADPAQPGPRNLTGSKAGNHVMLIDRTRTQTRTTL